jgi:hypothetical protein
MEDRSLRRRRREHAVDDDSAKDVAIVFDRRGVFVGSFNSTCGRASSIPRRGRRDGDCMLCGNRSLHLVVAPNPASAAAAMKTWHAAHLPLS